MDKLFNNYEQEYIEIIKSFEDKITSIEHLEYILNEAEEILQGMETIVHDCQYNLEKKNKIVEYKGMLVECKNRFNRKKLIGESQLEMLDDNNDEITKLLSENDKYIKNSLETINQSSEVCEEILTEMYRQRTVLEKIKDNLGIINHALIKGKNIIIEISKKICSCC